MTVAKRAPRPQYRSIQKEVLAAAQRLCGTGKDWTFTAAEVVAALPHLDEGTVRTHVVSRCCVNAPINHAHRLPYFSRLRRGVYQIEPEFRRPTTATAPPVRPAAGRVSETASAYAADSFAVASAIHAVVTGLEGRYVAECLEVAVLTQGRSLDEVVTNLHKAVTLHMKDEDPAEFGLTSAPRLVVSYETSALGC